MTWLDSPDITHLHYLHDTIKEMSQAKYYFTNLVFLQFAIARGNTALQLWVEVNGVLIGTIPAMTCLFLKHGKASVALY